MGTLTLITDADRVRTIIIQREEQLNALSSELIAELHESIEAVQDDAGIGAVVVRGAGSRAFCAGADLSEIRDAEHSRASAFIDSGHALMDAVAGSSVPVVAAINGWALGGGFELSLACHLRVASTNAKVGLPEAKIGCMPGFGGTQRIFAATTSAVAMRLLLVGDPLSADEAHAAGLLSVPPVEPAELDTRTQAIAGAIANGSREGNARILKAAAQVDQTEGLAVESALAAEAIVSADGQEGITSFTEKRAPQFDRRSH